MASLSLELGVAESLLHKWKKVRISSASNAEREVFELRKWLREVEMEEIGRATVQKVMQGENLRAIQLRSYKPQTTDSKHGLLVSADLLQDEANAPVGKW